MCPRKSQHEETDNECDMNWLMVTASCEAPGAVVWVSGPLVRTDDLYGFCERCGELLDEDSGEEELYDIEPELGMKIEKKVVAGETIYQLKVDLVPEENVIRHEFHYEPDTAAMKVFLEGWQKTERKYPTRHEL